MDNEIKDEDYQYDNGFHPKEVKLKSNYRFYRKNIFYKMLNKFWIILDTIYMIFPKYLLWGYKTVGKKNKKYAKGAVIVQNHVHPMDGFTLLSAFPSKRIYITMLESNLGFGIVSHIFRNCGCVPIPTDSTMFKKFYRKTIETLKEGYTITVFPEAMLYPYCNHIRKFHNGAFKFAYDSNKVILPCVTTYHKPKGFYKLVRRKKPCIHYNILEPYYIEDLGNKKLSIDKAMEDVHKIMFDYYEKNSDYFK